MKPGQVVVLNTNTRLAALTRELGITQLRSGRKTAPDHTRGLGGAEPQSGAGQGNDWRDLR